MPIINYTTTNFLAAIRRELAKRVTTYPKTIEKKRARGESPRRIQNELNRQAVQNARLEDVRRLLADNISSVDFQTALDDAAELRREMKMREKAYPRMIRFHRITVERAEEEKALWAGLIAYFEEQYLGTDDAAWLCGCGHYEESGFHCSHCGAQPPYGCDCSTCQDSEREYEEDFFDENSGFEFSNDPFYEP